MTDLSCLRGDLCFVSQMKDNNMPRGVKVERPVSTEPIEHAVQASTLIVLHPGSTTMWLGRATDHLPKSYPHVIAWRKPAQCDIIAPTNGILEREGIYHPDSGTQRDLALSVVEQAIWSRNSSLGTNRKTQISASQVSQYNGAVQPEVLDEEDCSVEWTDVSAQPTYVTGEQALYIDPKEPYMVHWPIKQGSLNLHDGVGGSMTAIVEDLERIWSNAIKTALEIPLSDLSLYRAVLVVPESFNKNHIKEMMDILINRLKFSSAIIQKESVCSLFGCGLSSACVVDVGDEKTSLCCVEDGLVIPSTRLLLHYGGRDITRCFFWLMQKVNFPYKECDLKSNLDAFMLTELKETFCHLSPDIVGGQIHEFQVHHPNEAPLSYNLKIGNEAMQAPMGMFFPQLFGIVGQQLISTIEQSYDDPEDLLDDRYLLESQRGDQSSKKNTAASDVVSEADPETDSPIVPGARKRPFTETTEKVLALDQAIIHCIECCAGEDTKRKMYGNILLVGGGFSFNGAAAVLQTRVQAKLPTYLRKLIDQVEVIARPKEMDPRIVVWKGGAVLSILDSAQELWVTEQEWNLIGVRALREKSLFVWS